ncbi:hypothetical protein VTG60DRAFT_4036 [Thermothelomyces hinnuleus]
MSSLSQPPHQVEAGEETPLLSRELGASSSRVGYTTNRDTAGQDGHGTWHPGSPSKSLPRRKVLLLCFARMTEPIAFFSIFPFVAQMVQRNGRLPESDVGFYSGLINSLFSATQMAVLLFWGRLADRVGRKPEPLPRGEKDDPEREREREREREGEVHGASSSPSERRPTAPSRMPISDIVRGPGVVLALSLYGHVMLLAFAFTAVLPVLLNTPVRLGGLGFGPSLISLVMATEAAGQALWLVFAFPALHRRLGTRGVLRACGTAYPATFAGYAVLNWMLRRAAGGAANPGVLGRLRGRVAARPAPGTLGTLNALALTVSNAVCAVAPSATSALYALIGVAAGWLPKERKPREADEFGKP